MLKRMWKKLVSPLIWIKHAPFPYWWYCVRTFPRECVRGIKSLIVWFPVIWADRDWDWEFLNDILIFKLKKMDVFLRDGHSADREEVSADILEVIYHLEQLPDDLTPDRRDGRPLTQEDYIAWGKKLKNHQTKAFYIMGTKMRHWWD